MDSGSGNPRHGIVGGGVGTRKEVKAIYGHDICMYVYMSTYIYGYLFIYLHI